MRQNLLFFLLLLSACEARRSVTADGTATFYRVNPYGRFSGRSNSRLQRWPENITSNPPTPLRGKKYGQEVQLVNGASIGRNLVRGAVLRIASDLSGGTPLESVKTRVTVTKMNTIEACRSIFSEGGVGSFWAGTPSRTLEGALMGALFMLGSISTKKQVQAMGAGPTLSALAGGVVGGLAQAIVMTPAGMVFTSLNVNKYTPGMENDNAVTVTRRILKENGIKGMFAGGGPMCIRQASNWASRAGFTEILRTTLNLSQYGIVGEIASGSIAGIMSCWNTPVETVRVLVQRDVGAGKEAMKSMEYVNAVVEDGGYPALFRGVTPRAIQAVWQTVYLVVVPNVLGF